METHDLTALKDLSREEFDRLWDSLGSTASAVEVEESDSYEPEVSEEPATRPSRIDQERQRFVASLPPKPYCSWDKRIRPKMFLPSDGAINYPYVQLNSPWSVTHICFDLDYGDVDINDLNQCRTAFEMSSALAWERVGLPEPTYTVMNLLNGHSHLIYKIDQMPAPNLKHKHSRRFVCSKESRKLLDIVTKRYKALLQADKCILNEKQLSKNPFHPKWRASISGRQYTLSEMAEYLPPASASVPSPKPPVPKKPVVKELDIEETMETLGVGAGRNELLFKMGRLYAYPVVAECGDKTELYALVHEYLSALNNDEIPKYFRRGIYNDELLYIVGRITNWTWERRHCFSHGVKPVKVRGKMGLKKPYYSDPIQWLVAIRTHQSLGGKHREQQRRQDRDVKAQAVSQAVEIMIAEGIADPSVRAVATRTGFPKSTVARLMKLLKLMPAERGVSHKLLTPDRKVIRGVFGRGNSRHKPRTADGPQGSRGPQGGTSDWHVAEGVVTGASISREAPLQDNHSGGAEPEATNYGVRCGSRAAAVAVGCGEGVRGRTHGSATKPLQHIPELVTGLSAPKPAKKTRTKQSSLPSIFCTAEALAEIARDWKEPDWRCPRCWSRNFGTKHHHTCCRYMHPVELTMVDETVTGVRVLSNEEWKETRERVGRVVPSADGQKRSPRFR